MEGFPNMDQESPLVGDILSEPKICSTVLAASGPEGVRAVLGLCREARYRAVTYTVRVPLPMVSNLLVHALLHWPVQQTVLLFGWASCNHACTHVVHIQLRFSGTCASAVSKNVLSAIADHISEAAGLKRATCAADRSASTSWTLDIELRAAGERERITAQSKLAALLTSPERATMHVRQAIPTLAEAVETLHVIRRPRIWGYAKSVAPPHALPPTAPRIHHTTTLGRLSIAPTAEHLESLKTLLCYPEELRALCVLCWRPTLFEAQRMQAAADACMRTLIDLVRGAVVSGATPVPPPPTSTTTSTFLLALDVVLRMGSRLQDPQPADGSDHYTARLGHLVKMRTALAAALSASVPNCERVPEYASQMRVVLGELLGALPALIDAHKLPTSGRWASGPMLSWIVLCTGQCVIRRYVARLIREAEENEAESNAGGGASSARGNLERGAGAQPPLLVEEAALAQMLSLCAPDAEVYCLRDLAALGFVNLWDENPWAADLSWSASPEQPEPPAFETRQLLSREGMPVLYDLYAGSCRLLAQRPLPLITELPPTLDAYALRDALYAAQRFRAKASLKGVAPAPRSPTDLTVCPRCGCSPTMCAAAHPKSVANIRHQLHFVMKQSSTQGESMLGVRAFPATEKSLLAWRCAVRGPAGSPWAGKAVPFLLRFCGPWPDAPPLLIALPPIPFHPNFDPGTGAVCMDLLQEQWSPAAGVLGVLLSAQSLLTSPTVADANSLPANVEAAHRLLREPAAYHNLNQTRAASLQPW